LRKLKTIALIEKVDMYKYPKMRKKELLSERSTCIALIKMVA